MIYVAIIFIVLSIIGLIFTHKLGKVSNTYSPIIILFSSLFSIVIFGWLIVLTAPKEKSHLEYLRGNLEVKYEYTYRDSILVKTDTIIQWKDK
jgi:hypothetical protein